MAISELDILNLFHDTTSVLTSKDIKKALHIKDPSQKIKTLVFFEYLVEVENGYKRTTKQYIKEVRAKEKQDENYEIVLNKIFSGSFLSYNLGHEIINFIKDDEGQRYIYLNPWGERGARAAKETKYVFHIIDSPISAKNKNYELAAVSVVDQDAKVSYSLDRNIERLNDPKYHNKTFYDIFNCGDDSDKAHSYTYKASKLLKPRDGLRILIEVKKDAAFMHPIHDDKLVIELICNPQHSIAYADVDARKSYSSTRNEMTDLDVLHDLLKPENNYLVEDNSNVDLENIQDEQCYAIISGRAQLEVSTSNQIAYFLTRDKHLTYIFLHDFLHIDSIREDEEFNIVREKERDIDLLFKSNDHVIVVENKIDSEINGVAKDIDAETGKYDSQLSKYYQYVENEYHDIANRHYFVLAPEYNHISRELLDNLYVNGDQYTLKTYTELYNAIKDYEYAPLGIVARGEGHFLFDQFKKSIEYLTWSNGQKDKNTAYIRLKQRLKELDK